MVCWGVRVLIWLLVVCVPAQAGLVVSLRASGPAHAHVAVPGAALVAAQATAGHDDEHDAWHAHEHGRRGFGAAHHDHDAADNSVVPITSPGDDGHGASGGGGKATAIEMPGLLPQALERAVARADRRPSDAIALAFASHAASPLYRPPR